MTCEECRHSIETIGWPEQLVNGCYCPIQRAFVHNDQKCDAIEELMFKDMLNACRYEIREV